MELHEQPLDANRPDNPSTLSAHSAESQKEKARLDALRRTGLTDHRPAPEFDRLARLAARLLDAPVSLVTIVDEHLQIHKGAFGLKEPLEQWRETPLSQNLCKCVVTANRPLIIRNTRSHPQTLGNPDILKHSVAAYLGIPLHTPDGHPIGAFAVIDEKPREWTEEDAELLCELAASVVTEIALKWQLEESRRLSERFERFVNSSPAAIYIYDIVEHRNVFISKASSELIGVTPDEIKGCPSRFVTRRMHPDDYENFMRHVEKLRHLPDRETATYEYRMRQPDGSWRWFLSYDVAYSRDESGAVKQVIGNAIDITERKQAEEALKKSEERLDLALRGADLGTWHWNMQTDEVLYSKRWAEMLGYSPAEVEPDFSAWEKRVHPEDRDRVLNAIKAHVEGVTPFFSAEHRLRTKDGHWKWILTSGKTFRDEEGRPVRSAGIHLDISDRKAAEAAALAADRQLASIFKSMGEACSAIAADWRYTYVNPKWEALFGKRKEQVVGKKIWDLAPRLRGTILEEEYYRVMNERVPVRFEFFSPIVHRWLDMRAFPAADGGLSSFIMDIHERKLAEEAVHEASRRKDEFIAMLGHELRNPLAAIRHALTNWTPEESPETFVWAKQVIERQSSHLMRLVDELLDVSRITRGKVALHKERLNVVAMLDQAIDSVRPLFAERQHRLDKQYQKAALWLDADPVRMEQIIVNLLTNAAKYTPPGGEIFVTATCEVAAGERAEAVIQVSDNGIGIPPEKLPQMFDLFVQGERSLARPEGGLGLGLPIVKTLTEMHGGTVQAESEGRGKGSTFTVRLPALTAPTPPAPPTPDVAPRKAIPHRVLVVDDLHDTAQGLARLLRRQGHTVEIAEDGLIACEKAHAFAPDVVLLDIGLPGMSGYEVAEYLRRDQCCADATIIAITGYGQEEDRRRAMEAGFNEHLVKPVDIDRLKSLVGTAPTRQLNAASVDGEPPV